MQQHEQSEQPAREHAISEALVEHVARGLWEASRAYWQAQPNSADYGPWEDLTPRRQGEQCAMARWCIDEISATFSPERLRALVQVRPDKPWISDVRAILRDDLALCEVLPVTATRASRAVMLARAERLQRALSQLDDLAAP
jgi:hypothetical protein